MAADWQARAVDADETVSVISALSHGGKAIAETRHFVLAGSRD
jgi:hypothetical protein